WIACRREHDRDFRCCPLCRNGWRSSRGEDDIDLRVNKLVHDFSKTLCSCPPMFDCDGAPIHPAQLAQPLDQSGATLAVTCRRARNEKSEFGRPGRGLSLGGQRPREGTAAEKRDELAASHSITLSTR